MKSIGAYLYDRIRGSQRNYPRLYEASQYNLGFVLTIALSLGVVWLGLQLPFVWAMVLLVFASITAGGFLLSYWTVPYLLKKRDQWVEKQQDVLMPRTHGLRDQLQWYKKEVERQQETIEYLRKVKEQERGENL